MDGGTFVTSVSAAYPKADGDRAARALSLRMQQEEEEQRLKDQMRVRADLEAREERTTFFFWGGVGWVVWRCGATPCQCFCANLIFGLDRTPLYH